MLLTLILFVISFICWYYYVFYSMKHKLRWVPSPPGWPLLGNIFDFKKGSSTHLETFSRYIKEHGKMVNVQLASRQLILCTDTKFLEYILSSNSEVFLDKSVDYKFVYSWLGEGLLTSSAATWKKRRHLLTPAFHYQLLDQFLEVFERNGEILLEKWMNLKMDNDGIDIRSYLQMNALDNISECAMGVSINAQKNDNADYVNSVKEMCRIIVDRAFSPIQMYDTLYWFTKNKVIEDKAIKIIQDHTMSVIRSKVGEINSGDSPKGPKEPKTKKKLAFLDLLLQIRIDGELLPQNLIREEVDTFMFEGHDTIASSLCFTLFLLANNANEQHKAFEEQKRILGENCKGNSLTPKQLDQMKYLDNIVKESLRLYPSVPFYARKITNDIEYTKGNIIPKDTTITIYAYGVNRDPDNFDNPDKFIPERWEKPPPSSYSYIPFSAGPRNCIGKKFAMNEMKYTLSMLIRNFNFYPTLPAHKLEVISETVLKSQNGFRIRFKPRTFNN